MGERVGLRARKAVALKVFAVVVVVATFAALRQSADPQRVVDRHVDAMRSLFEELQQNPHLDASDPAQIEWNERRDSLVLLGHLDRVEHVVPLAGNEVAQARLYKALDEEKGKSWISDWNYRAGSGLGIVITVVDESWRHAYWKDTIDQYRAPLE